MRMVHYYLALAVLAPLALLATAWTGIFHDGSQKHVGFGLFTAIFLVAVNTLVILFMIVTGRVLKAAMQTRPLGPSFLEELNRFFAQRSAYPVALLSATAITATAVTGYGRNIGVPLPVHMLLGIGSLLLNLWALQSGYRTLRRNQDLVDRVAAELDRIDRETPTPERIEENAPDWAFGPRWRWLIFAISAWLPYLYWGLVVWRGKFDRVPTGMLVACGAASVVGLLRAWRAAAQSPST